MWAAVWNLAALAAVFALWGWWGVLGLIAAPWLILGLLWLSANTRLGRAVSLTLTMQRK